MGRDQNRSMHLLPKESDPPRPTGPIPRSISFWQLYTPRQRRLIITRQPHASHCSSSSCPTRIYLRCRTSVRPAFPSSLSISSLSPSGRSARRARQVLRVARVAPPTTTDQLSSRRAETQYAAGAIRPDARTARCGRRRPWCPPSVDVAHGQCDRHADAARGVLPLCRRGRPRTELVEWRWVGIENMMWSQTHPRQALFVRHHDDLFAVPHALRYRTSW